MEDSTKSMSKMLGTENALTAVHRYLYARYMAHYIYKLGKPKGLVHKPPPEEILPEIEEMIEQGDKMSSERDAWRRDGG